MFIKFIHNQSLFTFLLINISINIVFLYYSIHIMNNNNLLTNIIVIIIQQLLLIRVLIMLIN